MSTQRPFFYNFLAAFRAHSAIKPPSATSATAGTTTPGTTSTLTTAAISAVATSFSAAAQPRSTSPEPAPSSTPRAISSPQHKSSTLVAAFSPPTATHSHHHTRRSSNNPGVARGFASTAAARRGSDSSSDGGFRDALGGEKWFIGGRTPLGEERFYRLGMARRERSIDRASLDRMSL